MCGGSRSGGHLTYSRGMGNSMWSGAAAARVAWNATMAAEKASNGIAEVVRIP